MTTTDQAGRRPPGPPRTAGAGLLMAMARDRLGMMTTAAAHGDAVRLPVGHKTLYFFNHPDHAKYVLADNSANYHKGIGLVHARRALGDGLLTSEGALWREQRRVIRPVFRSDRMVGQADIVADEAAALVDRLRRFAGRGPVDVLPELTGLTLGVLGRALLASDLGAFPTIGDDVAAVQDQAMFELVSLSAVPMWVPLPRQLRFRRARRNLQRVVDALVAGSSGRDSEADVLRRLQLSAEREADPGVGRRRIRDELVTLLLAGHETTASTLSWTMHLIDGHPEVRERLHTEAVAVFGGRAPRYEDLPRLRYTTMVVEEVMRMYPPVWLLPRRAQEADVVNGFRVPRGADLLISPYTLHRHREWWSDPERFDPERFDQERVHDRPRYAYIPFGAGPRFCVGNNLGLMEAVLVVAVLARDLRLVTAPGHRVVPEPMLSLRVRGGLPMSVEPRG